jgi:hypothetical protein
MTYANIQCKRFNKFIISPNTQIVSFLFIEHSETRENERQKTQNTFH